MPPRLLVPSHQSLAISHSSLLSNFGVRGCGGGFAAIYKGDARKSAKAVLSYRHPERAETTYVRQPLPERVRTESKDLFVPPIPRERGSAGSIGSIGRTGVVRCIIIGNRREYI